MNVLLIEKVSPTLAWSSQKSMWIPSERCHDVTAVTTALLGHFIILVIVCWRVVACFCIFDFWFTFLPGKGYDVYLLCISPPIQLFIVNLSESRTHAHFLVVAFLNLRRSFCHRDKSLFSFFCPFFGNRTNYILIPKTLMVPSKKFLRTEQICIEFYDRCGLHSQLRICTYSIQINTINQSYRGEGEGEGEQM